MEKTVNKIVAIIWAFLFALCLISVILSSAWWHLATAALSAGMAYMCWPRDDDDQKSLK